MTKFTVKKAPAPRSTRFYLGTSGSLWYKTINGAWLVLATSDDCAFTEGETTTNDIGSLTPIEVGSVIEITV